MTKIVKLIQKKLSNIFIAINQEQNEFVLKKTVFKNGKTGQKEEKKFPVDEGKRLSSDMKEYLISLQNSYKFVYISIFLESISQNCLPTCDEKKIKEHGLDLEKIIKVCVSNSWSAYALKSDIEWIRENYSDVGIDFIYSPFIVLNNFISKKTKMKNILHILYSINSVTLMIFNEDEFIFSAFFKVPYQDISFDESKEDELKPEEETMIEGINLDEVEPEEDAFEGFVDIDKLDDEEEKIDDDILQVSKEEVDSASLEDLELYGKEVVIFRYIKASIEEYYKNDRYDSEFLEDIIFYCDSNISNDIISMVENDLFLAVEIKNVDIKEEMINMSLKEVGL